MLHVQLLNVDCGGLRDYKQDKECHFPIKDRVELVSKQGVQIAVLLVKSRTICRPLDLSLYKNRHTFTTKTGDRVVQVLKVGVFNTVSVLP